MKRLTLVARPLVARLNFGLSRISVPGLVATIACAAALAAYAVRARVGLVTLEFGDETEKFVAAVMLRGGSRLYDDLFANHGPLAYALAWLATFVIGLEDFTHARLIVVALALGACAAIAASPALPRRATGRLWVAALFLAPLSALWFVHPLHMLIYHALGGYLMMIVIAQLTLPAIIGARIGRWSAAISGAAAMLATTAAYPFAAAGALFVAAAALGLWAQHGWRPMLRTLAWMTAGVVVAAVPMAVWITAHADWVGSTSTMSTSAKWSTAGSSPTRH